MNVVTSQMDDGKSFYVSSYCQKWWFTKTYKDCSCVSYVDVKINWQVNNIIFCSYFLLCNYDVLVCYWLQQNKNKYSIVRNRITLHYWGNFFLVRKRISVDALAGSLTNLWPKGLEYKFTWFAWNISGIRGSGYPQWTSGAGSEYLFVFSNSVSRLSRDTPFSGVVIGFGEIGK